MSVETVSVAGLVVGGGPVCARCGRPDGGGLSGWLGFGLCGLCLLIARARAHHNDEKETVE